ncbi:MAG: acyl-CoA dehydrogenase family protein [Halieaceae bacterium]|jgi:alkylation response protein AidB-like acyl-CoA dehydrogenase|nr:acyl-CoA dehydrogenase family protein [Halieaceae bacterium]
MAQPRNYGFEEEAGMLKDSARRLFAERLPSDRLHALVAAEYDPDRAPAVCWDEALWQEMVGLGWTSLAVPERAGGLAMPWVAVAGLVEESGRAAVPAPLLVTLQVTALLRELGPAADSALAEIAAGCAATVACMDEVGRAPATGVRVVDGKLSGVAPWVQDAGKSSRFLVLAEDPDGSAAWYWVAGDAAGLQQRRDQILDLTRDQASLVFEGVACERIAAASSDAWRAAETVMLMLLSAEMVGAAEWQLQTTVDYAQQRQQFDRPLGFFQAVKHQLVNVMLAVDESKSLLYSAACALDHEPERARELALMAKASAGDTAGFASGRAVQCHGGIGFTWECYVQLYFKRQEHSRRLYGDAASHRAELARILVDRAA